jgi:alpha-galactosidase
MARLDDFTLNVLCNSEVIAINQDLLGKQARIVRKTENEFILAKPVADNSLAVGLFNLGNEARNIDVSWSDLGIQSRQEVRDLWRQKSTGTTSTTYSARVSPHGVMLVRLSGKKPARKSVL